MPSALFRRMAGAKWPPRALIKRDYYIKNEYGYSFLICRIDMLSTNEKFINDI